MQIAPIDSVYSAYEPYDVAADDLTVSNVNNNANEESLNAVNQASGIEETATAVAINAISPESIELQELQNNIVSTFDDLKDGKVSREEFSNSLEELGVQNNQENPEETEAITDLTSALIESVKGNSQGGGEIELSQYASIMDIVNKQTQSPSVNDQLQAYTQNLRN